jgi:hypothetical protein
MLMRYLFGCPALSTWAKGRGCCQACGQGDLLEQTNANSAAKKLDGDYWFGKDEKPKKA